MTDKQPTTPIFSIITVTYNAGKVLEETLQSVVRQTYRNVEYILVDGGSKDQTLEIANKYRAHISRMVSEPDKGLYDAMNKGIRMATGDYLCFLNARDKLHNDDTLQQVVQSLQNQEQPDIIYGETAIVDETGKFLHMRRLSAPEKLHWKSFKQGMLVCHQAFWPKRTWATENLYDLQYRFSADFDWCIRIMKQTDNFMHLPFTVADYLQEGMTTRNQRASLIERFRLMCRHYGILPTITQHLWFVVRAIIK